MNELTVFNFNQVDVVDSREVAKLVEKRHKNLLADIRGYLKIMEKSTELKIQPSDFFLESSYKDNTGRELPCYLLTKKGCDMVANKMTGEKGVLFTAAYVTAFEKMREKEAKNLSATHVHPSVLTVTQRPLTTDDYIKAAAIVAGCPNVRLPYVLDFLEQGGFHITKLESPDRGGGLLKQAGYIFVDLLDYL